MALRGFPSVPNRVAGASLALALGLTLGGCPSPTPTPTPTPSPAASAIYRADSMDALNDQLAMRAQKKLGQADDFRIIPTQGAFPIGSLIRPGSTIQIDEGECRPATPPQPVGAPSLFPSYALTREAAAALGIGEALLEGVASAGANVSRGNTVKLDFADSAITALSDGALGRVMRSDACAAMLRAGPVLLVRGYVLARRTFSLAQAQQNEANLKLTKVADFDVKLANGSSGLAISDKEPVGFLQIVSELRPAAPVAPSPTPSATGTAIPGPPPSPVAETVATVVPVTAPPQRGRIYVQRDVADASGTVARVIAALGAASLPPVAGKAEAIASDKVPVTAQVRYFNAGDQALAQTALGVLQGFYPNATVTRVRLPSPAGQLEVWLPRGGRTRPNPLSVRTDIAASKLLRAKP